MAKITRIIPRISTQFKTRWKKITLKIEVTIGWRASMMLTTSDGAYLVASIKRPNGRIVPNRTTVLTEETRVVEICGGLTQNGR